MITRWLGEEIAYDGSQLRAHWILRHTAIAGDALVAFRGPCRVDASEIADLQDLLEGPGIAGDDMVHFLWERFDEGRLEEALLRQRLLTCQAAEAITALADVHTLRRDGDDLYLGDGKLSISIATRSPVSTLIHFALNVRAEGVPVAAAALADIGIEPRAFAEDVLVRVEREERSLRAARVKIRAKGEA